MEALLKRQMEANQGLITLVNRSEALARWMDTEAGKALQQEINARLDEATTTWMRATDPVSKEALAAHFEARVCVCAAEMIAKILQAGPEARKAVQESDRAANSEMNENG